MPATLVISILLLSALSGWLIANLLIYLLFSPKKEKRLFGFTVTGVIPGCKDKLAAEIASAITRNWLNETQLLTFISGKGIMEKLRPEIELHVDVFLKEKIQETFPLLYKFMGEKTLAKFKEAFLAEVETLFPELLKSYTAAALKDIEPEKRIEEKIKSIDTDRLSAVFKQKAGNKLILIKLLAALIGVIIGILEIFLILLIR